MERIIQVGIIGCGGIANGKHLPSLKTVPCVRMVAFCDIIRERAEKAARDYGTPDARVYTDYRELLKDPSIDVVHVLTPNREHADITIDALHAGKHVMCEKPMAKTAADAHRMVKAAEETGKKLTIGYQSRYKSAVRTAKEYIDAGELGEIYHANCYALRRRGTPTWGVFLDEEEQGGGPLIDIATHSLDMTLYLMNNYEPAVVLGKTHKKLDDPSAGNPGIVPENSLEEAADALIIMKNGAVIVLETSWALNTDDPIPAGSCRLCGSKAGLMIRDDRLTLNRIEHNHPVTMQVELSEGGIPLYEGVGENPLALEAHSWIHAVLEDEEPVVTPKQACVVSDILEAIYRSSKTGQAVYFD